MSSSCDTIMSPELDRVSRKSREVTRHRLSIVRDEDSAVTGSYAEHVRVRNPDNTTIVSTLEIKGRFAAAKTNYDLVIEVSASAWNRGLIRQACGPICELLQASRKAPDYRAVPADARPRTLLGLRSSNDPRFPGSPYRRPGRRRSARVPGQEKIRRFLQGTLLSEMRIPPSPGKPGNPG